MHRCMCLIHLLRVYFVKKFCFAVRMSKLFRSSTTFRLGFIRTDRGFGCVELVFMGVFKAFDGIDTVPFHFSESWS